MSESEPEPQREPLLQEILELLVSAGYSRSRNSSISAFDNVTGGLTWCIGATDSSFTYFDDITSLRDQTKVGEEIEAALKSMECPYPLQSHQIQGLDYKAVYRVVQWLVGRVLTIRASMGNEAAFLAHMIEEGSNVQELKKLFIDEENSVKALHAKLEEQDQKKANFMNEIQYLREIIDKEGTDCMVQRLTSLLELLRMLERKEFDFRSFFKEKCSELQAEVLEMEKKLSNGNEMKNNTVDFDHSLTYLLEKLSSAKNELAAKLRANLLLKRRLDDVPSQTELIQYEHRFSELYVQIQEKLRQTRKYYATYNALLEIKELMLKEISLLNSICSQFQDAMTSTTGRVKLIDSMERIVKGTQQKLEKVQLGLHSEQKICNIVKEKHAANIAEQRRRSSLLKAFQEECARSEKLQRLIAF